MTALIGLLLAGLASDTSVEPLLAPALLPSTAAENPVPPPGESKWSGAISLGASKSTGNTERTTVSATGDAELRHAKDRTTVGLVWNYASEGDVGVTQRRVLGNAKYDYFIEPKTYLLAQTSGESDSNADLKLRATLGAGVGHQFREDEQWKLSGEGGLAYFDEDFTGSESDADYIAARLAYKAEWKSDTKWTLAQTGEVFPSLESREDVYSKLDTRVRLALTDKMFAQFQWLFTWDNTPAQGADRADNLYLLTLGWSF